MAQWEKNAPAMQATQVHSLIWEDPLEEGIPLQYSCLENSMDRGSLVGCSPWGCKESYITEVTEHTPTHIFFGEISM